MIDLLASESNRLETFALLRRSVVLTFASCIVAYLNHSCCRSAIENVGKLALLQLDVVVHASRYKCRYAAILIHAIGVSRIA